MKVHEYQAKEILARYGVAIPRGILVTEAEAARSAAQELGGRVVVKAQVHAGGRGKAGGVKLVGSPAEAVEAARADPRHDAGHQADRPGGQDRPQGPGRGGARRSTASSTSASCSTAPRASR